MQCQSDWRNSVSILQDYITQDKLKNNSPEIQDHIQSLIECVENLFKERSQLRSEWEENTITFSRLQHRYDDLKKERGIERNEAITSAKQQNDESIQEIKQITKEIQEEMDKTIQRTKQLNHENKSLEVKAEEAKLMWPQLCAMMCTTMQKKAALQITVNETRCKTVEAHQRAVSLMAECKEIELDIENYWKYCCVQANKIKSVADVWKAEIAIQEKKTEQAKIEMDELQEEIKWSQTRNLKANIDKNAEEEKLVELVKRTESFKKQVRLKLNEKAELQTDIKNQQLQLCWFKGDYELQIQVLEDNDKTLREECVETFQIGETLKIKKSMATDKLTEVSLSQNKKEEQKRKRRNELMEITTMMNMVVADEAVARTERMKLKKSMVSVADNRDQMERMFSFQLNKLNETVKKERKLRKKHLSHWEDSVAVLKHWNKETNEFFEKSEKEINTSLQVKENYNNEYDKLLRQIEASETREASLKLQISENQKKFSTMKQNLIRRIDTINHSIEIKTAENSVLLREKIALDPQYDRILKQFTEYSCRYESFVEKLMNLNREKKNIEIKKKNCKQKMRHISLPWNRMRKELSAVNLEALEQIKRSKKELESIGIEIAELISRHDEIESKNLVLKKGCQTYENSIQELQVMPEYLNRCITSKFIDLSKWRRHLLYLIKMEENLENESAFKTEQDQKSIGLIKFCADQRKIKLETLTNGFEGLIANFTSFLSSNNI